VCSSEPSEVEWAKQNEEYRDFKVAVYDKYDDMLNHPGLQAVWVSSSTDAHAPHTLGAIEKGLHVLCEKPLGHSLEEVCKIERLLFYVRT
jgi:myo-inositol 2-dehydrogenase/D-chiro-inositol 1-dehydrogenase